MSRPQSLRGTELANEILASAGERARTYETTYGRPPCLATVLVGDDPASITYVRMKQRRCQDVGVASQRVALPHTSTTAEVVEAVRQLSSDEQIDGILVQHPVPPHVDERAVFEAITPAKDVDGVTMHSFASMSFAAGSSGSRGFESCTPSGIVRLLDHYDIEVAGKHAVVIGRSPILGKPIGMLLLARDATVTFCHSKTVDLPGIVAAADIVVAAVGRPNFVRGEWLQPGAVVVDAGYHPGNVGDVDHQSAGSRAGAITPVPGGVGPMTIAVLVEQTVEAAFRHRSA
ncbi:MAG: bifunctional 5,10-methylenetetrahydrofolate dehydrogenase/5,10-methenyltetrahydrofolate cyclohydrolase [Acidimicrobiales bacterium]